MVTIWEGLLVTQCFLNFVYKTHLVNPAPNQIMQIGKSHRMLLFVFFIQNKLQHKDFFSSMYNIIGVLLLLSPWGVSIENWILIVGSASNILKFCFCDSAYESSVHTWILWQGEYRCWYEIHSCVCQVLLWQTNHCSSSRMSYQGPLTQVWC
jgi:hypothetical protein